jgi:serine protease AprX
MAQVEPHESGSVPSDRTPADRGWSLDIARSGRLGGALSAVLLAATIIPATALAGGYDPGSDVNSMASTTAYTGAAALWDAGITGDGVDVAVIDTGVSRVEGLATPGKVIYGPDLSLESQAPDLRNLDTNGHGTFMAGLIAGRDAALSAPYSDAPASAYRGMAPDARIVSVKVGVADGGVDVSQVIAAIDWVVQHRTDNDLNIRVINLSYGTNSAQPSTIDPLAYAAEQAWKAGILVVAAGGNYGFQSHMNNAPALADPATDRYVVAVGSSDSEGTMTIADDSVPAFSPWPKRGATRGVDLIAPGAHLQGLRVPKSYNDLNHPEGQIDGRFFRGSGTSESAALVSGAAALLYQMYPTAKPDRIKKLLTNAAVAIGGKAQAIGGGELQLQPTLTTGLPASIQTWPVATGIGTLEGARGLDHLTADGVVLTGEQDIFGQGFDSLGMAAAEADHSSWSGGTWNGSSWSGSSWSGDSWSGNSWSGSSWSGNSWSGSSWSGNSWSGNSWSGNSWSGNSWSGNSWSGNSWSTATWD